MKTNIAIKMLLALCFAFLVGGCKPKSREGEAFVVLKSDEVKPMADIEIIGFGEGFGMRYVEWQAKWYREVSNQIIQPQTDSRWREELNQKLNDLSAQIEETRAQRNAIEPQAKSNQATFLSDMLTDQRILTKRVIPEKQSNLANAITPSRQIRFPISLGRKNAVLPVTERNSSNVELQCFTNAVS